MKSVGPGMRVHDRMRFKSFRREQSNQRVQVSISNKNRSDHNRQRLQALDSHFIQNQLFCKVFAKHYA